ncbi:unnamed protein product, partial [marine sediment metagenome]
LFVTLSNSFNSPLAFIITLTFAAFIGFCNGMITLRAHIPSFIATLGMMLFLRGSLLAVTGGESVSYKSDIIMPTLLTRYIGHGFRPSHIWFFLLTLLFSLVLTNTRYGNWVFATGGNKEVARAMGVNVNKVKVTNFMLSSLMAIIPNSETMVSIPVILRRVKNFDEKIEKIINSIRKASITPNSGHLRI